MDNNNNQKQEDEFLDFYLSESLNINTQIKTEVKKQENNQNSQSSLNAPNFLMHKDIEEENKQEQEIELNNKEQEKKTKQDKIENLVDKHYKKNNKNISSSKIKEINKLLNNIKEKIKKIESLIIEKDNNNKSDKVMKNSNELNQNNKKNQIIEGIFDGEKMIGDNDKQYSVASNYASKSKLVEGDKLKLIILNDGSFVYKQINQVERASLVCKLEIDKDGKYFVINSHNKKWKVLKASITYYQGESGDEVVVLVPKYGESDWATVEYITKNNKI